CVGGRVKRHADIARRAPGETRRRQIEALQPKRERQLQTVGEQSSLILSEEGVAALQDVERAARRGGAFVGREISVAFALEFISGGQQIRAAEPHVDARHESVDVAGEIADRSEGRLAEPPDAGRPDGPTAGGPSRKERFTSTRW